MTLQRTLRRIVPLDEGAMRDASPVVEAAGALLREVAHLRLGRVAHKDD